MRNQSLNGPQVVQATRAAAPQQFGAPPTSDGLMNVLATAQSTLSDIETVISTLFSKFGLPNSPDTSADSNSSGVLGQSVDLRQRLMVVFARLIDINNAV